MKGEIPKIPIIGEFTVDLKKQQVENEIPSIGNNRPFKYPLHL